MFSPLTFSSPFKNLSYYSLKKKTDEVNWISYLDIPKAIKKVFKQFLKKIRIWIQLVAKNKRTKYKNS